MRTQRPACFAGSVTMLMVLWSTFAAAASIPLPTTPSAAASQAFTAAARALASGKVRLQIQIHGDSIEDSDSPLPLLTLCARLAELNVNPAKVHLVFDHVVHLSAWKRSVESAKYQCRLSRLDADEQDFQATANSLKEDALMILVAPCNRPARKYAEPSLSKLERVQQLVCAAGKLQRPVILANPELEALLLTRRVGNMAPPMFLSDFEHAFFLAEAEAKVGFVTGARVSATFLALHVAASSASASASASLHDCPRLSTCVSS